MHEAKALVSLYWGDETEERAAMVRQETMVRSAAIEEKERMVAVVMTKAHYRTSRAPQGERNSPLQDWLDLKALALKALLGAAGTIPCLSWLVAFEPLARAL